MTLKEVLVKETDDDDVNVISGFGMISSAIYYGIAKRIDSSGGVAIWRA